MKIRKANDALTDEEKDLVVDTITEILERKLVTEKTNINTLYELKEFIYSVEDFRFLMDAIYNNAKERIYPKSR